MKKGATTQCQVRKLYSICKYLTFETHKPLAQPLVILHLAYCCSLLLGTNKANMIICNVSKTAARFIFGIPHHECAKLYMRLLYWLPVNFSHMSSTALTHKLPSILQNYSRYKSLLINTRSSREYRLVQHVIKNKFSGKAFSVMGPFLWNNLDNPIRSASSTEMFKKLLKTILFKKAYTLF